MANQPYPEHDDAFYNDPDQDDPDQKESLLDDSVSNPGPLYADYPANTPKLNQPPPLQGCFICFAENTITLIEKPTFFNFKAFMVGVPLIACSRCGATAQFDPGITATSSTTTSTTTTNGNNNSSDSGNWRVRYKKINDPHHYHYAARTLGVNRWLNADEALELAARGFMQRQRLDQAAHDDLSFLPVLDIERQSSLLAPDELIYAHSPLADLYGSGRDAQAVDRGVFILTDRKVHLHGARRDWSHDLRDLQLADFTADSWRITIGKTPQVYSSTAPIDPANADHGLDAQLFVAVVQALARR